MENFLVAFLVGLVALPLYALFLYIGKALIGKGFSHENEAGPLGPYLGVFFVLAVILGVGRMWQISFWGFNIGLAVSYLWFRYKVLGPSKDREISSEVENENRGGPRTSNNAESSLIKLNKERPSSYAETKNPKSADQLHTTALNCFPSNEDKSTSIVRQAKSGSSAQCSKCAAEFNPEQFHACPVCGYHEASSKPIADSRTVWCPKCTKKAVVLRMPAQRVTCSNCGVLYEVDQQGLCRLDSPPVAPGVAEPVAHSNAQNIGRTGKSRGDGVVTNATIHPSQEATPEPIAQGIAEYAARSNASIRQKLDPPSSATDSNLSICETCGERFSNFTAGMGKCPQCAFRWAAEERPAKEAESPKHLSIVEVEAVIPTLSTAQATMRKPTVEMQQSARATTIDERISRLRMKLIELGCQVSGSTITLPNSKKRLAVSTFDLEDIRDELLGVQFLDMPTDCAITSQPETKPSSTASSPGVKSSLNTGAQWPFPTGSRP